MVRRPPTGGAPRRRPLLRPASLAVAALLVGMLLLQNRAAGWAMWQRTGAPAGKEPASGQQGTAAGTHATRTEYSQTEGQQNKQSDGSSKGSEATGGGADAQQQQQQGTAQKHKPGEVEAAEATDGKPAAAESSSKQQGSKGKHRPAPGSGADMTPAEQRGAAFAKQMSKQGALKPGDPLALSLPGDQQQVQLADAPDLAAFSGPNLTCVVSVRVPKVALMFLTTGPLPFEHLWSEWLRKAGGVVPRASLAGQQAFCLSQCDSTGICQSRCGASAACNPACLAQLQRQYGRGRSGRSSSFLGQQSLYSLYVHAPPDFPGYNGSSIFKDALIPNRVKTEWASHSLTQATKNLIEEAVKDPDNQWFALISDTTAPLYSSTLLWQQLMHESRSRIDACWHDPDYLYLRRASGRMNTSSGFRPLGGHWRKASQWFMLRRDHAELVAADTEINAAFAQHCHNAYDEDLKAWRDCISDEHYIASLLAFKGQDNATTCHVTAGTFVDWQEGSWHPVTYQQAQISSELMDSMRLSRKPGDNVTDCSYMAAINAAPSGYVDVDKLSANATCTTTLGSADWLAQDEYAQVALPAECNLLARKFDKLAVDALERLYKNCDTGLKVLPCSRKVTVDDSVWWGKGRRLLQPPGAALADEAGAAASSNTASSSSSISTWLWSNR